MAFDTSTDIAKTLRANQAAAREAVYDALNAHNWEQTPEVIASNAAYDETVKALQDHFGEDAPCFLVDGDLYSLYSDLYKDRCGFRPKDDMSSRARIQAWLETHKNVESASYPDDDEDDFDDD